MRHAMDQRKLGRTTGHRIALLRNLAVALVTHERITTTLPKAKELRRVADRLVTWGKRGTLAARRKARRWVDNRDALTKVFAELAPRFSGRAGGYTRILKVADRPGDQAPMALIEYLPAPTTATTESKPKAGKTAKKTKTAPKKVSAKKA